MSSKALNRWHSERAAALERLERVHGAITGGLAGRPRDVTELNHALFLRLASEVQGYCRDLHDEAIDAICTPAQVSSGDLRAAFRSRLQTGRKLDSGNAGPGNIGTDWTALGMTVWPDLNAAYPGAKGAGDWNARLEWLNMARNGIAHNDPSKISGAHAVHPLTLNTFRVMRRRLDKFATGLDRVTQAYLKLATGSHPW
ncbi:hypothetical protein ACVWW9_000888 [Agrococcus sp. UYP33]